MTKETLHKLKGIAPYGVMSFLALVAFGSAVGAATGFSWQRVEERVSELLVNKVPALLDEVSLGGNFVEGINDVATSTTDLSSISGWNINDRVRYGDDPNIRQQGVTYKYAIIDFTNGTTIPVSVQNKEGKTIYLDLTESFIQFTGLPTSSVDIYVGHGTQETLEEDENENVNNLVSSGQYWAGGISSSTANIAAFKLEHESSAADSSYKLPGAGRWATGTVWRLIDAPSPQLDASSTVAIDPGNWIHVYASSTATSSVSGGTGNSNTHKSITGDNNLFDGNIFLRYFFID